MTLEILEKSVMTENDLIKKLESYSMKIIMGSIHNFESQGITYESFSVKFVKNSPTKKFNTIVTIYQRTLEQIENYAKGLNQNFKLFSITSQYSSKQNKTEICYMRDMSL